MYIIIWRNSHKEPFPNSDLKGFLESYSSPEEATEEAKEIIINNPESEIYFDFEIYKLI